MSEPVDFFIHVPKTAGTTMLHIIQAEYPPGTVLSLYQTPREEHAARLASMGPEIRIVASHLHAGMAQHFPRPARSFAMLREPVERLISNYYFIEREPTAPAHRAFHEGKVTFENLSQRQGAIQARFLAGYAPKDPVSDGRLLADAKAALTDRLIAFGLTERFDESLLLFNAALGWNVRGYVRENVTKHRPQRETISDTDLEIIRANSRVDLALYDFARELFAQRMAALPDTSSQQLSALRRNITMRENLSLLRQGWAFVQRRLGLRR